MRLKFIRHRIALGWSQQRAAVELGVSNASVTAWESPFEEGHTRIPGFAADRMRVWAREQANVDSWGRIRAAGRVA